MCRRLDIGFLGRTPCLERFSLASCSNGQDFKAVFGDQRRWSCWLRFFRLGCPAAIPFKSVSRLKEPNKSRKGRSPQGRGRGFEMDSIMVPDSLLAKDLAVNNDVPRYVAQEPNASVRI